MQILERLFYHCLIESDGWSVGDLTRRGACAVYFSAIIGVLSKWFNTIYAINSTVYF